uniref:DNA-directed RNA polymerase n=1 Tax=Codium arabicum TaxID=221038 RepID=A0A386B0G5_CODAR|nr:RNA polymerase b-subunit [Codium arabicum]AYC65185.1 RNA polymerase b-subunit [Codium arabicum]
MTIFFDRCFEKKRLKQLLLWFYHEQGEYKTLKLLEKLKSFGFKYATQSGLSIGLEDLQINLKKSKLLRLTEFEIQQIEINQTNANITSFEKFQQMITVWINKSDSIKKKIIKNFQISKHLNPLYLMAFSGARGNISQVRQLVGLRGLMSDPQGNILDFPIRSNFREGLTLTEYIISCYGARKGIVDTALRTATSGYLTRRLVDVAQHVFIEKQNCHTSNFIWIQALYHEKQILKPLQSRLIGRALGKHLVIKQTNSQFPLNLCITFPIAKKLSSMFQLLPVRSPLICNSLYSICQYCYGWNLASEKLVSLGEAIGVLAAQSIGEPGTQLTMRTFHTGGVFSGSAIDQIYSPYNGYIYFPTLILGHLIRTLMGQIGFLTKQDSVLILKTQLKQFLFKVPSGSILYIKQNEYVFKEQLLAQLKLSISNFDQSTAIEQHTYTDYNGQIFFENIKILQKKSLNLIIRQYTQTLGTIWIAKVFASELSVNNPIRAQKLDLINNTVNLQKFHILIQNILFLTPKKRLLFQNKTKNKNTHSELKYFEFNTFLNYSNLYFKDQYYIFLYNTQATPFLYLKCFIILNGLSTFYFKNFQFSYLKLISRSFRTTYSYLPFVFFSKTYYQLNRQNHDLISKIPNYWKTILNCQHYKLKQDNQIRSPFNEVFFHSVYLNSDWNNFCEQTRFCFVQYTLYNSKFCLSSKNTLFYLDKIKILKCIQTKSKIGQQICIRSKIHINSWIQSLLTASINKKFSLIWFIFFLTPQLQYKPNAHSKQCSRIYYCKYKQFYSTKQIYKNLNNRILIQKFKTLFKLIGEYKLKYNFYLSKLPNRFWSNTHKFFIKKTYIHYNRVSQLSSSLISTFSLHMCFHSLLIQTQHNTGEYSYLNTLTKWNQTLDSTFYSPCLVWKATLFHFLDLQSKLNTTNCNLKLIKKTHFYLNFKLLLFYFIPIQTSEFLLKNFDNSIAYLTLQNFKTYKIKHFSFFLGQFYQYTNKYFSSGITQPGLIYAITKTNVIVRQAEPKLLSANGIVHVQHRTFVKKKAHFFTMFYTYSQTGDIIQGIPKIEDFFEARHQFYNNPLFTDLQTRLIYLYNKYRIQYIHEKAVRKAILKMQTLIVEEVQKIYLLQGIVISDKHIEIIVRQMTSKVRITSGGSTGLLNGELVDLLWIETINRDLRANKIQYDPVILGITKTCLETSSFISAASFQETVRVLTQSAVQNKLDFICGLKENVILGHLIPSGTGFFSF